MGLVLGEVSYSETSNSADYDKVISQSYDANASLPAGTAVGITLGKEKETTTTYKATVSYSINDPTGANSALGLDGSENKNVVITYTVGSETQTERLSLNSVNSITSGSHTFTGFTSEPTVKDVKITVGSVSYTPDSIDLNVSAE